jgi:putative NIF3 family GTP cyclohydrolase 1 type 2
MDLNAHGTPNGKPEQYYKDLAEGELKDYCFRGFEDRETCYFVGMYLRILRALEFLKSQPEWDGKILVIYGESQGGGQAIAGAALDPQITMVSSMIPGLCDQTGFLADQSTGWPRVAFHGEMPTKPIGEYNRQAVETARYIDPMNFAPRIRTAKAMVFLGFIDTSCPPTTIYAMYNNLATQDKLVWDYPDRGHFYGTDKILEDSLEAIAGYLRDIYGPLPMDKTKSKRITPNEMVQHFYDNKPPASWVTPETTVDRVIIGDGDKKVSRILVTWMPSLQAVQAAIDGGYDMILAHEPTFYDHRDYRDNPKDMEKDAMVMKKKRLIEESGLVIVRCHDFWDLHVGDGIPFAWAKFLGIEGEPVQIGGGTYMHRYDIAPTTVEELAKKIAGCTAKTGEPVIQVIGDGKLKVSKVGIGTGCATNPGVFQSMGCDVAVITDDGTAYWREIQRAADMGFPVIRVSHCASEDPGMETLAEYVKKHFGVQADYYRNKALYRLVGQ